mgnify:CR=1 FL=1
MKVISVNVGRPAELMWKGTTMRSSIVKTPVEGPVAVRGINLEGDQQSDLDVHGGPNKSLYAYPSEYYAWWKQQMPALAYPRGAFGENLTTEGLLDENAYIGDTLRVGTALLKITQPRMPCSKLQFRFQNDDVLPAFVRGGRHGCYFAILEPGEVGAGDAIDIVDRDPGMISIADVVAVYYRRTNDRDLQERVVNFKGLPLELRLNLAMRAAR